ncbi:MAG: CvpA family protein [bacterium]
MDLLDLAIIVFLAFFLYRGVRRGVIREIFGLVAVLGALVLAVVYMDNGVAMIEGLGSVPTSLALTLSFLLIFVVVYLSVRVVGAIFHKLVRLTLLGWLDHLGGLFFGLLKGVLIASLILLGLTLLSWPRDMHRTIDRSILGPSVQMAAPRCFNRMKFLFPAAKSVYQEFQESVRVYTAIDPEKLKEKAVQRVLRVLKRAE